MVPWKMSPGGRRPAFLLPARLQPVLPRRSPGRPAGNCSSGAIFRPPGSSFEGAVEGGGSRGGDLDSTLLLPSLQEPPYTPSSLTDSQPPPSWCVCTQAHSWRSRVTLGLNPISFPPSSQDPESQVHSAGERDRRSWVKCLRDRWEGRPSGGEQAAREERPVASCSLHDW